MSAIFDILASNAAYVASFATARIQAQTQVSPLATIEAEISALRRDVATVGNATIAVYNASARMIAFDAALGQLLGITV